ncbi:MAG: hypothetical protein ACRD82_18700 [Blastocatellia bacterium]
MMEDRAKTYLTILTKNDLFSFLGLVRAEMVDADGMSKPMTAIIKHDPREGQPILKQFHTGVEALHSYEDAISTSLDRGWSVVYRGLPLEG